MANRELRTITQRLSLRPPQEKSLEILAQVLDAVRLEKEGDTSASLNIIQALYPGVTDFEREFPSLCFALATGVGKTRLMGAFIAYLYLTGKSRNFFVLAPNKTIYEKLIGDFSPESPKYVFRGIAEFAQNPPEIVTVENYKSGAGIRLDGRTSSTLFGGDVHVNIFNIDIINKEESPRGKPQMKALQETIGESYYSYLSKLDDLVLLMDEAHRYRASAGVRAISGLKPILGLELTATPKTVGAASVPFCNVIYRYGLGEAMEDGFVKEPAVATRKDFDPRSVPAERLEQIKLEDAVHYHDHVSVELDRYHRVTGKPKVHPFILVVAQDTDHARNLRTYIESDDFFTGRFRGRVIEVHSALKGDENEDSMKRLVGLERDNNTDIVIHVNKLKEGWDVTNLYTIVPLRASASEILTEQTLGRGLRLPYGARVAKNEDDEFAVVDRLTVIAHERFDEVIQAAKQPGSIVMKRVEIGEGGDVSLAGAILVDSPSSAQSIIFGISASIPGAPAAPTRPEVIRTPQGTQAATVTLDVIRRYERKLGSVEELRDAEVQEQIVADVRELLQPVQPSLTGLVVEPQVDIQQVVETVATIVADCTISIPQIVVLPKRQINFYFADFDLSGLESINVRPVDDGLVIQTIRTEVRQYLAKSVNDPHEDRLEDYLVRYLIERNEVDYDSHADLLYKLSGQVVERISSYLDTAPDIESALLRHGRQLAEFIFAQMMQHYHETPLGDDDFEVKVTRGFRTLDSQPLNLVPGQHVRTFKQPVSPLSDTKKAVFGGFTKCCATVQKFDSDPERRFAVLIDDERTVEKWLKPGRNQFQIEYRSGEGYEPDFVVETITQKLICEVKKRDELEDDIVKAKAKAATKWCSTANRHAVESGGKRWRYVLIPDDQIIGSASLDGLVGRFGQGAG
ncbi:MAG: DEAD/DEAH box helicase family protein [Capsulimonadaceae bacterium]|nr:DEAD/DEAH box helicase family protein [Capsulimonadaceae bacterium]